MQAANKTLAGWLVGSIAGAGALVGAAAATRSDAPTRTERQSVESTLALCDLGDGEKGRLYGDVCSTTPPFGWISGSESASESGESAEESAP